MTHALKQRTRAPCMAWQGFVALCLATLVAGSSAAAADADLDPMRLPEYMRALQDRNSNTQDKPRLMSPPEPWGDAQAEGLQLIVRSRKGSSAVIDGQHYRVGDRYGNGRLVEIRNTSVVIEENTGRSELSLYPGLTKKRHSTSQSGPGVKSQRKELTR